MAYTQADLDEVRAARMKLARGERVDSVNVGGQSLDYAKIGMDGLLKFEREIAFSLSKRRRRAYGVYTTKGL